MRKTVKIVIIIRMMENRQNLHNHTLFSDGNFSWERIVDQAESSNLEIIGISDHYFTTKVFHDVSLQGWLSNDLIRYLKLSAEGREKKRAGATKILWGMEIDTCLERLGCSLFELPWNKLNSLDFILFEYIGEKDIGGMDLNPKTMEELRANCRIPAIIAHPNIDKLDYYYGLENAFDIFGKFGFAIEIPAGCRNKWYWHRFDPKVLYKVNISIGTDTHEVLSEVGNITKALNFIQSNGLSDRLLKFT
ncbi:MAG: hypothetical protein HQM08_09065 [Candidatus Riflebacteria bacterium]|nr:hypothetical protein [Candidatus Riflebacteria bacterium]